MHRTDGSPPLHHMGRHHVARRGGSRTGQDRVRQASVKAALEPEGGARFAANSSGFRPGRGTMDAVSALHTTTNRKDGSQWVLAADSRGGFANIAHAYCCRQAAYRRGDKSA